MTLCEVNLDLIVSSFVTMVVVTGVGFRNLPLEKITMALKRCGLELDKTTQIMKVPSWELQL